MVTSIGFLIKAYSVREYVYPMGSKHFFDTTGNYDEQSVENVRNLKKKQFNTKMFRGYLLSIKTSGELNHKKAIAIKWGQSFLTSAIMYVTFLIAFILVLMGAGMIRLG
jgi:viroplasmin and RNaseH domain-containing protein